MNVEYVNYSAMLGSMIGTFIGVAIGWFFLFRQKKTFLSGPSSLKVIFCLFVAKYLLLLRVF